MPDNGNKTGDSRIDSHLRRAFAAVSEEPLPDRFTELLNRLRDRDAAGHDKGDG